MLLECCFQVSTQTEKHRANLIIFISLINFNILKSGAIVFFKFESYVMSQYYAMLNYDRCSYNSNHYSGNNRRNST
jgi:hypothetical protein